MTSVADGELGVLWGAHISSTQGQLATLVADAAPAELRGTAFGAFNLITGVTLLLASLIAGGLWDATGPEGTFLAALHWSRQRLPGFFVCGRLSIPGHW